MNSGARFELSGGGVTWGGSGGGEDQSGDCVSLCTLHTVPTYACLALMGDAE